MNNKKGYFLTLFTALSLLPLSAISGKDPIGWKLNQQFQNPVYTGRTYSVTYTLTNKFPFQLVKPLLITKQASQQNDFSYTDNCSGTRLKSQGSCTVVVSLTPSVNGTESLQLIVGGYDSNQVKLPKITTTASSGVIENGVTGSVIQALPAETNVGIPVSFEFSFTNNGTTTATNTVVLIAQSTTTGQVSILTNSCMNGSSPGTLSAKGGVCTVTGTYTPNSQSPATQNVTATLTFQGAQGSPANITTTTQINQSTPSGYLVGSLVIPYYLPPLIQQPSSGSTPMTLKFLFTNVSGSTVTFRPPAMHVGSVSCLYSNNGPTSDCSSLISYNPTTDSSCITSLNPTAACQLQATFNFSNATQPGTYTVTASVPYNGSSTANVSTSGSVVTTIPTTRTISLVNQCNFNVWFSLNGSAVSGVSCDSSGNGCPAGTSCNTTTKTCFWSNPNPNTGTSYLLSASGGSNSVTIHNYNYGGVQWSGNISASPLCNGTSCGQADCKNQGGTTYCAAGQGFSQPATPAEITMNALSADSYDVETINGFHMPISMTPMYYLDPASPANNIPATPDNYTCVTPGNTVSTNGFGACNWKNVVLPQPTNGTGLSSGYYLVTNGGKSCTIASGTSQCSSGQVCGLYQDPSTNAFSQVCGNFLGYWSADQVCSYANIPTAVSNFFNCNQSLPVASGFPANSTLYNLMACKVPTGDTNPLYNSCYLTYSGYSQEQIETCCGCVDWLDSSKTSGQSIAANSDTQSCGTQVYQQWTQYIQPMIQWMKAACPSAYVYQFDDKTSGFGCTTNLPTAANSTGYIITFCPGGNTGLPTNVTEGR